MATSDGESITVVKDMGLVTSVFDDRTLASLDGHIALGHVRYSTGGASTWQNAQPVFRPVGKAGFALGHNGNLTNVSELEAEQGVLPGVLGSDSDLVAEMLATAYGDNADAEADTDALIDALSRVLPRLKGAFSLGLIDADHLIAVRDPNGFRPLCLGRLDAHQDSDDGGWVIASETAALDVVGARFVREIAPGEMLVIDENGPRSMWPFPASRVDEKLCIFEFVYFARADTRLYGNEVHAARRRMGEQLAKEWPADADLVMGVPESANPAAEGYAERSGIPFGQGLVKSAYMGRSFIEPTQQARVNAVRRKLNPLRESVRGRRLVIVDDSIVRGTTIRHIVQMMREAGATEVHLRISSPPFRWPCFYGIDTPRREELLAARMTTEEMRQYLDADSLAYLGLDGLLSAIDAGDAGFCSACLTGKYPTEIPVNFATLEG